ncbi:hypothetical protein LX36DRAFT_656723 [Colletotrichum falcatum]|nr:hypothetical protein LX36DRAFT_656723 [Colletotrichum falcatum]
MSEHITWAAGRYGIMDRRRSSSVKEIILLSCRHGSTVVDLIIIRHSACEKAAWRGWSDGDIAVIEGAAESHTDEQSDLSTERTPRSAERGPSVTEYEVKQETGSERRLVLLGWLGPDCWIEENVNQIIKVLHRIQDRLRRGQQDQKPDFQASH